jgi:hypothetical protein
MGEIATDFSENQQSINHEQNSVTREHSSNSMALFGR